MKKIILTLTAAGMLTGCTAKNTETPEKSEPTAVTVNAETETTANKEALIITAAENTTHAETVTEAVTETSAVSEEEYEIRRPIIYGFLVSVSTDALTIPIINDVKKLSDQENNSFYKASNIAYELQFERLSTMTFERFLDTVASSNSLELNDVNILYYLYKKKKRLKIL